jgi:hypothetical protein
MAGTATIDDERLVSAPEKRLLFMSRRSDLRMFKRASYAVRDPNSGEVVDRTQAQVVAFVDGQFRCEPSGTVTLTDTLDAGIAEVDGEELVSWLLKHRLYGDKHEGFWRVDPTAPPVSKDEMKGLLRAAQRFDVDALERALADERAGWNREDVIETIESTLADTREVIAELEAEKKATGEAGAEEPPPEPEAA